MIKLFCIYLLIMNAAGFFIMLADKRRAKKKRWRIRESTLLAVAALGGSVGAYAGMNVFHHKTRKPKFFIGIPLIIAAQTLLAGYLYYLFFLR